MKIASARAAAGALAAAALVFAILLSPPGAVPRDAGNAIRWFAAIATAFALVAVTAAGMRWSQPRHASRWLAAALALFAAGASLYVTAMRAHRHCTAPYAGSTVIIGERLTPFAQQYVANGNSADPENLLLDAAGRADAVWIPESIAACRTRLILQGSLWFPALAASFAALAAAGRSWRRGVAAPASRRAGAVEPLPVDLRYDVFLSYRHGGADTEFARELLLRLEEGGYRVAIDERDFQPQQNYVQEMERCILESRYTLAIISNRYLESGNTEEEALIAKVLTLDRRQKRLIPILIERTQLPLWLRGAVGIDFGKTDGLVEPLDMLTRTLGEPLKRSS